MELKWRSLDKKHGTSTQFRYTGGREGGVFYQTAKEMRGQHRDHVTDKGLRTY